MKRKALITGVQGQDGFYLSEFLQSIGYEVVGTRRGNEEPDENPPGVRVVFGDVTDAACMRDLIRAERPGEIYNLAALTHVGESFKAPQAYLMANAVGVANCLGPAMEVGAKFYQASTSELYGDAPAPQSETTPFRPRSPYGCAKLAGYWMTRNYRERGLFAVNGILFNHESPRRGGGFVTQKVARAVADIHRGLIRNVTLGNLEARRDWGHAKDFVRGMWLMMQQDKPDDYVLATGKTRAVGELCHIAFSHLGLDWMDYVKSSPDLMRPLDVENLCGDASKARMIGWVPEISFETMVGEMVDAALKR